AGGAAVREGGISRVSGRCLRIRASSVRYCLAGGARRPRLRRRKAYWEGIPLAIAAVLRGARRAVALARARSTLAGSGNLERADAALAPVVHGHGLAFKAKSSLDERAGRADEPYSQRGDCSVLPLRQPPPASPTHANIPRRLQLRQASQASGRLMRWHATWSRHRRHARRRRD